MTRVLIVAFVLLAVCACETDGRDTAPKLTVRTTPAGAIAKTETGLTCLSTPCVLSPPPGRSSFVVTITKAGYKTQVFTVTSKSSGLSPNPLEVQLELDPAQQAVATSAGR